ncbi:MAG: methyltransferase domain-containing protein [Sphaerospermopsis sp. SIO1G2]|nr:methyltransferase domain-containing protein [Sphaerospermopsis sp. SIO1G2]
MTQVNVPYTEEYFSSWFFDMDYQSIATTIVEIFQPKTVADFGCGPGNLSKELAKLGVQVTAVDGYSQPDFSGFSVEFHRLDLNDSEAIANFFTNKSFDLSVSVEVAEHLKPETSPILVNWLTKVAPVVIFSASVPEQESEGHINLRPREYWHDLFTQHNFVVGDRIRERLRPHPRVAHWYRYSVLDYVHVEHPLIPNSDEVIRRLIASESAATTAFYEQSSKLYRLEQEGKID